MPLQEAGAKFYEGEMIMINLQIRPDDFQGDMVPTASSPFDKGGVRAATIVAPAALYSPGGAFRLTFLPSQGVQIQCINDATLNWKNKQLLDPRDLTHVQWIPIWTGGGTTNQAISEIDMQLDGNFVVYVGTTPIFNSQTDQNNLTSGAFLRLQDDGNLVIIMDKPIWDTGTNARSGGTLVQKAA
jgi:hypothetical protein